MNVVLKELVFGGHLLALGTASIGASSAILIGQHPTIDMLLVFYLFTYGAYSLNRSMEIGRDFLTNFSRSKYLWSRRQFLPYITAICFILGHLLAALRNSPFFAVLFIPVTLSYLYSTGSKKLLPVLGVRNLKESLLVKNITISFGYALVPILAGLYYEQVSVQLALFAVFVFLRLLVNTIFFDLRDLEGDSAFRIRTIPTVVGRRRSYRLLWIVDSASALFVLLTVVLGLFPGFLIVTVGFFVYSGVYRHLAQRPNANMNLLCDVVADGEYILWAPVILLGSLF